MSTEKYFSAFGESRTAAEWARDLNLSKQSVTYYVVEKGLTVEELFELRGIKYTPPKQRKPRGGIRMKQTQERMKILLVVSGYIESDEDEAAIVVKVAGTNGGHSVDFKGRRVGTYHHKTGQLRLSGGEGLPLSDLEWEDAKIVQDAEGRWHPHRDTKRVLLDRTIKNA